MKSLLLVLLVVCLACAQPKPAPVPATPPPIGDQILATPDNMDEYVPMQQPKPVPKCAKQCTWNFGAEKKNQCWTYMIAATSSTQAQVPGYSDQPQPCSWTYYLKGDGRRN